MSADIENENALGKNATKTVNLDQQAVGRLSRMDALQQQAMAKAQMNRRATLGVRISAALLRITEGEFGFCTDCGAALRPARLEADPTIPRCISCTKG
jgi:DnaK suppressor protein